MKAIQIHYQESNGSTGVMNYFSGENPPGNETEREKLLNKASKMAGSWASVFPETKFTVREIEVFKKAKRG